MANASIDTNLYYGVKNKAEVQELQEFLIDGGFFTGNATGNFYSLTLKAVKAYQTSAGLPKTGYVGVLTRKAINDQLAADLQASDDQAIADTGSVPAPQPEPIQNLNQATPTPAPSQVQTAPAPAEAPAQQNMTPFDFTPILTNRFNQTLITAIKEKFDKCTITITDENGHVVDSSNHWEIDNDGNSRHVYSMGTTGIHTYSITCSKAGFEPNTKTGDFPAAQ